jgi:hypothetical protein
METKPSIDPGVLAPIILGLLSIVGIAAVFFYGRESASRQQGEVVNTVTPFRYMYLGTEPGLSTLTPEPTETPMPAPTEFPDLEETPGSPSFPTSTSTAGLSTQPSVRTPAQTPTPTVVYDDTDDEILYEGEWTSQTNVPGVYQNTLHVSYTVENYAYFSFVGQQVIITYQKGPNFGSILINIDGLEFIASQSNSQIMPDKWTSGELLMGSHDIAIEHLSGESVNIDSIIIPDLRTPTPGP